MLEVMRGRVARANLGRQRRTETVSGGMFSEKREGKGTSANAVPLGGGMMAPS